LLYWVGIGAVTHADLSAGVVAPLALGDPSTSFDTTRGTNIVMYRGTDGHVHSLYWSTGGTAHDNLSASAGAPQAQGDAVPYYTSHNDMQQVVYQGVDGRIHELWWVGQAAVTGWNLSAAAGAPPSASDPAAYYSARTNTKHVVYRSFDGHLHEISWTPGSIPGHVDLTLVASAAPTAVGHPSAYFAPHDGSHHVIYRTFNGHLNELTWVR
jgi:hypothetical protein